MPLFSVKVIANEYGLLPLERLSIGSKVCRELVGKILCDMANMKEESLITCISEDQPPGDALAGGSSTNLVGLSLDHADSMMSEFGRTSLEDEKMRNKRGLLRVKKMGERTAPSTQECRTNLNSKPGRRRPRGC